MGGKGTTMPHERSISHLTLAYTNVTGCCSTQIIELNPDGTPKEPQTKEQKVNDPRDLREATKGKDFKLKVTLLSS